MHLKLTLLALFSTAALAHSEYGGYGVGDYHSSKEHDHHHHHHHHHDKHKPKCQKLEYFKDIQLPDDALNVVKEPIYTVYKNDGKTFIRISCPNDSVSYYLFAHQPTVSTTIGEDTWDDVSLLTSGFNIGYVARCYDEKTIGQATNKKFIEIEQVACVAVSNFAAGNI